MAYRKIATVHDIKEGTIKTFNTQCRKIAIIHLDSEFFAIDDTCTHAACSLGTEGILDGSTVICGCHGAMFDVKTGKVLSLPAPTNVSSYEVMVEGENILVDIG